MRTRIATILFHCRLTAQLTTGMAPSELLLGCRPQSHLDLLKPNTADRVERQQAKQVQKHNIHARERSIGPGYRVNIRNYQSESRWLAGVVQDNTGPVSFRVKMQDGRLRRYHLDQVRSRSVEEPVSEVPDLSPDVLPSVSSDPPAKIAQPPEETGSSDQGANEVEKISASA